jgi:1-deoxy-D-xylulose-5-phosphate synthase
MILENIQSPQDLKKLSIEQLVLLSFELRQRMIEVVSKTGGHLASSLGTVELTLALHYCLDLPRDRIVWDVGHQAYAHKLLTGRCDKFSCLRQYQGITGFPCKDESAYDSFTTGHSSTAVSLALGLACANALKDDLKGAKAVAVIGDGSISGGLCFEGLNNAGHLKKDLLVVLNTNEHSIAPNVGALSTSLNKIISLPIYNKFKQNFDGFVSSRIPRGRRLVAMANKLEEHLKGLFVPGMLFEELGFRYFGPFEGHNLQVLISTLRNLLPLKGPVLLHVVTKKGKGYYPAEKDPVRFHSAAPFDIATGASLKKGPAAAVSYTGVFSQKMLELGAQRKDIVAITAAMPEGTGLDKFRDAYPDRFYDVGIAEEHAVSFAGGLAKQGLRPVVAIYSTFLQRAYDQIIECVALQEVPVVFCLDRSGLVGEDGATHQGVFDIAFLRTVPGLTVMAPRDGKELEAMMDFAVSYQGITSLRYPKAAVPQISLPMAPVVRGKAEVLCQGNAFLLIALGSMVAPALEAAQQLAAQGLAGTVVNARFAKPLDEQLFKQLALKVPQVYTVEDGMLQGGFGSAVQEALKVPVTALGLPDEFIPCGSREILLEKYGLTAAGIADTICKTHGKSKT